VFLLLIFKNPARAVKEKRIASIASIRGGGFLLVRGSMESGIEKCRVFAGEAAGREVIDR